MKNLLEFILKRITDHPDEVEINVEEKPEINQVRFNIFLNPEDMGIVIGKDGHIIKSIRSLINVIALPKGIRVYLNVNEAANLPTSQAVISD